MTTFFVEMFYVMGCNLKNARNGMGTLKISKWQSWKPVELKSKFIRQFEFSENLKDLCGKSC